MKKNIVIGVTGGIAAYKSLEIVSLLKKRDFNIDVIMTKNAQEFVQPLTFQTISQKKVIVDMFDPPTRWDVEHIEIAKKADLFLIAPATANIIGKIAHGIADDMLSTTIMATKSPVVIVPAMNTNMYENKIVQKNIKDLKELGYIFIEPDDGLLACGDYGKGKMPAPIAIVEKIEAFMENKKEIPMDLKGKKILITAGPTVESIDPVRYITNHSSGKMGYAIAQKAFDRGAAVILISGPTHLDAPKAIEKINITSTLDMYEKVMANFEWADIIVKAAAVADYRPKIVEENKIKKSEGEMKIELVRNPDILQELGKIKQDKILVGFAAETQDLIENADKKIKKKNLDFIVANDLTKSGAGFKGETNIVSIIDAQGQIVNYEKMDKTTIADIILDKILGIDRSRKQEK